MELKLDYNNEDDLEYYIKINGKDDVKIIFRTIKCSETNSYYIYTAMANLSMPHFMKDIITPYIDEGYKDALYNFLDGWIDYGWNNKILPSEKIEFKNMIVNFLRTDKIVLLDEFYIPILDNIFNINYYAETMIG
jgi:hypothetical protein